MANEIELAYPVKDKFYDELKSADNDTVTEITLEKGAAEGDGYHLVLVAPSSTDTEIWNANGAAVWKEFTVVKEKFESMAAARSIDLNDTTGDYKEFALFDQDLQTIYDKVEPNVQEFAPVTSDDIKAWDAADDSDATKGLITYHTDDTGEITSYSVHAKANDIKAAGPEKVSQVRNALVATLNAKSILPASEYVSKAIKAYGPLHLYYDDRESAVTFDTTYDDGNASTGLFTYFMDSGNDACGIFEMSAAKESPDKLEKLAEGLATTNFNRYPNYLRKKTIENTYKFQARLNSFQPITTNYESDISWKIDLPGGFPTTSFWEPSKKGKAQISFQNNADGSQTISISCTPGLGLSHLYSWMDMQSWQAGIWTMTHSKDGGLDDTQPLVFSPTKDDGDNPAMLFYSGDAYLQTDATINIKESEGLKMENWGIAYEYGARDCYQFIIDVLSSALPSASGAQRVVIEHTIQNLRELRDHYWGESNKGGMRAYSPEEIDRILKSPLPPPPATPPTVTTPVPQIIPPTPAGSATGASLVGCQKSHFDTSTSTLVCDDPPAGTSGSGPIISPPIPASP